MNPFQQGERLYRIYTYLICIVPFQHVGVHGSYGFYIGEFHGKVSRELTGSHESIEVP